MSNGQTGAATARSSEGFTATTARDIANNIERIQGITERLNELGGRLIGVDQLPRNQRDKNREVAVDAPEPVRSATEQVTHQFQRMAHATDDLQEIAAFLEQL